VVKPERGTIVCSKSGRDKGYFLVVVETAENTVFVCDGKERPVERPKKKNEKHIFLTGRRLADDQLQTNRSIRHALNDFKAANAKGEI